MIVDARAVIRHGIAALIGQGAGVDVSHAESAAQAMVMAARERPDTIVLDADMPGFDQETAVRDLRRIVPAARIVIAGERDDGAAILAALRSGASGFVSKSSPAEDFARIVRGETSGFTLSRWLRERMLAALMSEAERQSDQDLTPRELDVLRLLADGMSARQIAHRLAISERTVNSHVASIYRRLHVNNRVDATREAIRLGLVSLERAGAGSS